MKEKKKKNSLTRSVQVNLYLTTFMISSKNGDSLRIAHLQGHQELVKWNHLCYQYKGTISNIIIDTDIKKIKLRNMP